MQDNRLYYEIDSWSQIPNCLSNCSKKLHLTYDMVMDKHFTGNIIRVEHDDYGCLFAYVVEASGNLLNDHEGVLFELSTEELLFELEKYGFFIKFSHRVVIDDEQYQLLSSATLLGMDRIRIMYVDVKNSKPGREYVRQPRLVLFDMKSLPEWLNNVKVCTSKEFEKAIVDGNAVNVSKATGGLKDHNWSFLYDRVLGVHDILKMAR